MDNLNQQTSSSKPLPSSLPNQTALSSPHPPNPSKTSTILLVVMLIVIVGVGGYTLGIKHGKTVVQNQQTTVLPTIPQPSPTPDETANWKTYRNDEFGFELKYPNQFMFFPRTDRSFDIMNYDKFDPKFERGNMNGLSIFVTVDSDSYKNKQEVLATIETEDELGKRTFVEEYLKESYGRIQYLYFRNSRWTSGSGTLLSGVFIPSHAIYDPQTGGLAIFQVQDPSGDFEDVIQQILATFKFTDQNQSPSPTPYIPNNPQIEEEGKLKVKNTPEVQTLIGKYGKSNVSIKALDVKLVKDIQFIMLLDPKFKEETGCIIVVESNNSGYVYQLDKNNDVLYKQTLEEFKQKTANVDQQILVKFYSSLS